MPLGIVEKLRDALLMFWQALDDDERTILLYFGCYLAANAVLSMVARQNRQQAERVGRLELLVAELAGGPASILDDGRGGYA